VIPCMDSGYYGLRKPPVRSLQSHLSDESEPAFRRNGADSVPARRVVLQVRAMRLSQSAPVDHKLRAGGSIWARFPTGER